MQQIPLDAELRTKLGNLTKHLELTDETGNVIAWIVPRYDGSESMASWSDSQFEAQAEHGREQYRQGKYIVGLKAVYAELRQRGVPGVPEE